MAGSSQSTSTTRAQSSSDTYIPEYSQTPFLQEYANHARAMSDVVYAKGMEIYNKNQGDIDAVMRDALSYASPQRIAVDMGMAEAGVQQAGERGRQSAIRDLESYGLDPSSGRYAALDSANRVMTAAAAAGAGNQQHMADQAAGNAMRQQAISAGLQNANYASSVNRDANAFLQTASSLKYPPLGRWSQSTSATDSQSSSVQTDPPQSSKGGGGEKQPSGGGQRQPSGGGGAREPSDRGGGDRAGRPAAAAKPPPRTVPEPKPPGGGGGGPEEDEKAGQEGKPVEGEKGPSGDSEKGGPDRPTEEEPYVAPEQDPNEMGGPTTPYAAPSMDPNDIGGPVTPYAAPSMDPNDIGGPTVPPPSGTLVEGYDPYANQPVTAEAFGIDPVTGMPTDTWQDQETAVAEADPAGALYGQEAGGGWTDTGYTQASYQQAAVDQDQMWSDIGQGTMADAPVEGATWDSAYDTWTDPGYELPTYEDEQGYGDWTDAGYEELADPYAGTDYGGDGYDYSATDYGDQGYEDDYADTDWEDYGDQGEEEYDFGDEDTSDWTDAGEEDYGDETYDFGDDTEDWTDAGDDSYTDYTEEDYAPEEYYAPEEDYTDAGDYEEEYYDEGGGDEGYDEGARGGAVMRGRVRRGRRRARIMPPRRLRRRRRRIGYAQGGMIPPQGAGMRLDPPPRPPGAALRAPRAPQAPRPMRGAPMAAPGGPRPAPAGRGPRMPGNFISANGMAPPTSGGMPRPQRMAQGGQAGRRAEPTQGGFVSRSLSPSGGSTTDDVQARLNAGEFVIPKDVSAWKGKEFFYKLIAQARKNRAGGDKPEKPQMGYSGGQGVQQ